MRAYQALILSAGLLLTPALRADDAQAASPTAQAASPQAPAPPVVAAPAADTADNGPVAHIDARASLAQAAAPAPADPHQALFKSAVWPGILWHGAGYAAVGDDDMALGLSGMEGFALFVSGFSAYTLSAAVGRPDESIETTQALAWVGGGLFVSGWVWDMCGSYIEAKAKAAAPNVSLLPLPRGAALAYHF
jgi:hypothetical protein